MTLVSTLSPSFDGSGGPNGATTPTEEVIVAPSTAVDEDVSLCCAWIWAHCGLPRFRVQTSTMVSSSPSMTWNSGFAPELVFLAPSRTEYPASMRAPHALSSASALSDAVQSFASANLG